MEALDEHLAGLGGGSLLLALLAAVLLGLRHATDPDHITAVATLVLSDARAGARRASRLGIAWGGGHAVTVIALGLPVVLFDVALPDSLQSALEFAIGCTIVVLAVRLLVRWRRGRLHSHVHEHDGVIHAHPHVHVHAEDRVAAAHAHGPHDHAHAERIGRSPLTAFGLGILHGAGGSAAVGVLLVAAVPGRAASALALALFACATAVSMALLTAAIGHGMALGRGRMLERLAPVAGVGALVFGVLYAATAAGLAA
jgi:hypothetical protein